MRSLRTPQLRKLWKLRSPSERNRRRCVQSKQAESKQAQSSQAAQSLKQAVKQQALTQPLSHSLTQPLTRPLARPLSSQRASQPLPQARQPPRWVHSLFSVHANAHFTACARCCVGCSTTQHNATPAQHRNSRCCVVLRRPKERNATSASHPHLRCCVRRNTERNTVLRSVLRFATCPMLRWGLHCVALSATQCNIEDSARVVRQLANN